MEAFPPPTPPKNPEEMYFSGKYHVKFGHLLIFKKCTYFWSKMSCSPKLTEFLCLCQYQVVLNLMSPDEWLIHLMTPSPWKIQLTLYFGQLFGKWFYFHFSSNRIVTLADLAQCSNLDTLFIRNNSVSDVSELEHLRHLSRLRVLWLEGNPCTKDPRYRTSLLQMLPKLHRLDNTGSILLLLLLPVYTPCLKKTVPTSFLALCLSNMNRFH